MTNLKWQELELNVSIDTRTLKPGDVFLALKGEVFDGHTFVKSALEKQARWAVVEHIPEGVDPSDPRLILVENVPAALETYARVCRTRTAAQVVAITGSCGKTTLKDMLSHLLAATPGKTVVHSQRSHNNNVGVPLSLCQLHSDTDYGVFEIGTNHPGEILPLVQMVKPHVAIVTNIEMAHIANFPSYEHLCQEKLSIASGLVDKGVLILPTSISTAAELLPNTCSVIRVGEKADISLLECELSAQGTVVKANIFGQPFSYQLTDPGQHIVSNSLLALACLSALSVPLNSQAAEALSRFKSPSGRGRFLSLTRNNRSFTLIDSSYNANPASMKSAIALLGLQTQHSKKIAILGDMLELGGHEQKAHEGLLENILASQIDCVIAYGQRMKYLFDLLPAAVKGLWTESLEELSSNIWPFITEGSCVLIKSSFGTGLHRLVQDIKNNHT